MVEKEHKFTSAMRENEKRHFHNEDLQAGVDFETALKLGCFDKEFLYYAVAYQTNQGIACQVSSKERNIQQFVHKAVEDGLYPTPIKQYIRRLPAPSGQESNIKKQIKKDAAKKVFDLYSETYFEALSKLSSIEANDVAYELLKDWQSQLEGIYNRELLILFEGLVHTAFESKILSSRNYFSLQKWITNVYKQLESDIVPKGQYKKNMAAFAYSKDLVNWSYVFDAKEEVAMNKRSEYLQMGFYATEVFTRTKWLSDMNEFSAMRDNFKNDYKNYCTWYLDCFCTLKNTPGVISSETFEENLKIVESSCSKEAINSFKAYKIRWNIN